jgi:3-mercaptopyruvate sulfurtransferase SseA
VIDVRGTVRKAGRVDQSGFQRVEYVAGDAAYFNGRVPTASFLDWLGLCSQSLEEFREGLAERGLAQSTPVCVYDGGSMLFATRLWKSLLDVGFDPLSTHVLNSGWAAWDEYDGPVDLEIVCPLQAYTPFYEDGVDDADADGILPSSEKGVRHVDAGGLREFMQRVVL